LSSTSIYPIKSFVDALRVTAEYNNLSFFKVIMNHLLLKISHSMSKEISANLDIIIYNYTLRLNAGF